MIKALTGAVRLDGPSPAAPGGLLDRLPRTESAAQADSEAPMCHNLNEEFDSVSRDGLQGHSAQPALVEDDRDNGLGLQSPRSDSYLASDSNWASYDEAPQYDASSCSYPERGLLDSASGTRYQRACMTRMAVFWPGKFYLENYDVS